MKIEITAGGGVNLEENSYAGACVQIIDMGTQTSQYGKKRKVAIGFYIADPVDKDGNEIEEDVIRYRRLPAKITKKTDLGKLLKKWIKLDLEPGDSFDLDELLEVTGDIDIEHSEEDDNGNVWDNITIVRPLKEKIKLPKNVEVFSLYLDDTFDEEKWALVPDWLKEQIEESPEFRKLGIKGSKKKKRDRDEDEDEDDKPRKRRGKEEDEDEDDEKPKRRRKPADDEEEEEDEKPKRRGKKVEEEEEEEEEDEKPKRRRKPEDEEEEEEDEKPKRRRKPADEEEEEDEKPKRRRR